MFYVFRKIDGVLLSVSAGTPIIKADEKIGVIEIDQVLPKKEWANHVVRGKKLKRTSSGPAGRAAKLRVEQGVKRAKEVKKKFWELVDREPTVGEDLNVTNAELREALKLLGDVVFPKKIR